MTATTIVLTDIVHENLSGHFPKRAFSMKANYNGKPVPECQIMGFAAARGGIVVTTVIEMQSSSQIFITEYQQAVAQ